MMDPGRTGAHAPAKSNEKYSKYNNKMCPKCVPPAATTFTITTPKSELPPLKMYFCLLFGECVLQRNDCFFACQKKKQKK